jgi:hypothetical protein
MRRREFIAGTAALLVSPRRSRRRGFAVGLAFLPQVRGAGRPSISPSLSCLMGCETTAGSTEETSLSSIVFPNPRISQGARPHRAAFLARPRRRGDRIVLLLRRMSHVRSWRKPTTHSKAHPWFNRLNPALARTARRPDLRARRNELPYRLLVNTSRFRAVAMGF